MERYHMHEYLATVSSSMSFEVFAATGLPTMIEDSLDETDSWEKKKCPLSANLMMNLVLRMNLQRRLSIYDTFKAMVSDLRSKKKRLSLEVVSEEAVYHARGRLGVEPVRSMFEKTSKHIMPEPSFHGLTVFAADGFRTDVPDTIENDLFFGRTKGSHGESGFPQIKCVSLVATETREVVDASFGPCYMSEKPEVAKLTQHLDDGDILLMDRGLPSFELFAQCKVKGPHFLARIPSGWKPRKLEQLPDGSWLVEIRTRVPLDDSEPRRQRNQCRKWVYMTVRMIEYTFKSTGEHIRLLTDLEDWKKYPALELALLYHERWETELVYDEIKTHLESTAQGVAHTVFRSQSPDGVLQEAYGMLAMYNLVRNLMAQAGRRRKIPPDEISFVGTLNVIQLAIPRFAFAPENVRRWLARQLLDDIAEERLDRPRRPRCCPRVIKKRQSPYPRKRAKDRERYFDHRAEIALADSPAQAWAR